MLQTKEIVELLREAAGGSEITTDPAQLDLYTADTFWRSLQAQASGRPLGRPDVVMRPATESDVAAAVRIANEHGVPVTAWGGGSGTQGASVPTLGGIVVDLRSLDEIVQIDEVSLTVTAQAGVGGLRLEEDLNACGLMLPHYAASVHFATVGGYVAARGSGVLSTRYGKIEDLLISLRVATPTGELIDMLPVPRHAAGPELTQLYVGSEGTLGIITRVTLQLARLPEQRRFETVLFPTIKDGVDAVRKALQMGHRPSVVRMYDELATQTTLEPVVHGDVKGVCAPMCFEGRSAAVEVEAEETLQLAREHGGEILSPSVAETWWEHRYDFYQPPHHPELPSIWGTIDVVATYARIMDVYEALRDAVAVRYADRGLVLKMHFSHWYLWGTMIYARFLIPGGVDGEDPVELHDQIWNDGVKAVLAAGGVLNDHHGVGLKLARFMRPQYGAAFDTMLRIKAALDPNWIMNPGKLGFVREDAERL